MVQRGFVALGSGRWDQVTQVLWRPLKKGVISRSRNPQNHRMDHQEGDASASHTDPSSHGISRSHKGTAMEEKPIGPDPL